MVHIYNHAIFSFKRIIITLIVALAITICFFVKKVSSPEVFSDQSEKISEYTSGEAVSSSVNKIDTSTPSEIVYTDNDQLSFSDLDGIEFWFGSGAGAWCTTVTIQADGTFSGYYSDSEMGSRGYMYPDGTRYECSFKGQFSALTKSGDYQYSLKCESIEIQGTVGEIRFEDNLKLVTSDPYGFDNADEFVLYLPGKKTNELPDEYISWTNGLASHEVLSCYGLYNIGGEEGFIVWPKQETVEEISEPTTTPVTTISPSVIANMQKKYKDNDCFSFADLNGIDFWSSRGCSFAVYVMIQSDGTFNGAFSETDSLANGDDYPNGTTYECNYSGQFSVPEKTGPYEYTMKCISLEIQGTLGEERIEDGRKIITTEPYGFQNADEFILYLPGKETTGLPEGFLKWYPEFIDDGVTERYILYNVGGEEGFVVPAG